LFVFHFKFLNYIKRCIKNVGETKNENENEIAIGDELIKKINPQNLAQNEITFS
jgi:hypothetical protein